MLRCDYMFYWLVNINFLLIEWGNYFNKVNEIVEWNYKFESGYFIVVIGICIL